MLNLIAPVGTQLGYQIVGLNVVHTLHKLEYQFSLTTIGECKVPAKYQESIHQGLSTKYNENWPTIKIFHQFDMNMPPTVKRFGMPIFELDAFNEVETKHLKSLDHIFVCSSWAKNVIGEHIGMNCSVVPLGVDPDIFHYRPRKNNRSQPLRLINIGKWEIRKGHDFLPDLLLQFPDINWELWMMPDNPFLTKSEDTNWKTFYREKLGDRVKFIPRMDNQSEVADVIGQCNLGVFPSRAEGFNLDLVEVMAVTGNKAYCTEYSAHGDILRKLPGFEGLSPYKTEKAFDGKWFFGQGNWAKLDLVSETLSLELALGDLADIGPTESFSNTVLNTFSWENTVKVMLEVI